MLSRSFYRLKIQQHKRIHGDENTIVDDPFGYDQTNYISYTQSIEQSSVTKHMYDVTDRVLSCKTDAELQSIIDDLNEW